MAVTQYKKVSHFKNLIKAILEEIQDPDLFDGLWKSWDAFNSSFNHDEYPIKHPNDEDGDAYLGDEINFVYKALGTELFFFNDDDGGPPDEWISRAEYFFRLASDHERVSKIFVGDEDGDLRGLPKRVKEVGNRHRMWLDVDTILNKMPGYVGYLERETVEDKHADGAASHVAENYEDAARRIEFLCQVLKLCLLIDDHDVGGEYGDVEMNENVYLANGTNSKVSTTISELNGSEEFSDNAMTSDFMKKHGYVQFTFTSPRTTGRGPDDAVLYPDQTTTYDWHYPGAPGYPSSPDSMSLNPENRGLAPLGGADTADSLRAQYFDNGRTTLAGIAAASALHHGADYFGGEPQTIYSHHVESSVGPDKTSITPALGWEKWWCQADFEGFLFWAAELIELLEVYYASKDWSEEIAAGTKPVFFGGKRFMSYPKASAPDWSPFLEELLNGNAGYAGFTTDDLSSMAEEIQRSDLLISTELRNWWLEFLGAYALDPLMLDSDGSDSDGTLISSGIDINTVNIAACDPEEDQPSEDPCADAAECEGNPNAFVVNWTSLDPGAVFFNEKTCEYSAVVSADSLDAAQDALDGQTDLSALSGQNVVEVIKEGTESLLKKYLKSEYIQAETVQSEFISTITGYEGEELSIKTMDVLFPSSTLPDAYYDQLLINQYLGFLPEPGDLPKIAENGVYIPEMGGESANELSMLGEPRLLVVIPAKLFNRLPSDYSSLMAIEKPETPGGSVIFKVEDITGNIFTGDMVREVCTAMRYYNKQYAKNAHFDSDVDYGPLDLENEADYIKSFMNDLKAAVEYHGWPLGYFKKFRAEKIEIDFEVSEEDMEVLTIFVNAPGCPAIPITADYGTLNGAVPEFTGAYWKRHRTLAYIQRLPDMWNDVTARVPLEYDEFIKKYTIGLTSSDAWALSLDSTSATSCWGDEMNSIASAATGEVVEGILDFPSALADLINKKACGSDPMSWEDGKDWKAFREELSAGASEAFKKGLAAGTEEFFAGDAMWEILPLMAEGFTNPPSGKRGLAASLGGPFAMVYQKLGWCGIAAIIDFILGCLLQGIPTADGLALLLEATWKGLPMEAGRKILLGLSPEQQDEIARLVGAQLDVVFATPPWEMGFSVGSVSSGDPFNTQGTTFERTMAAGAIIADSFNKDGGSVTFDTTTPAGTNNNQILSGMENDDYLALSTHVHYANPPEWSDDQVKVLEGYGIENDWAYIFPESATGKGTLGIAWTESWDAIFDAYKSVIFDTLSEEDMLSQLNAIPGAEILMSAFDTFDCAIPDLFDPPIGDFFKGMELDFCRGGYGFNWPKWQGIDFNFTDLMSLILAAVQEMVINLIMMAIMKIIAALIEMLLNSLCHSFGSLGAAISAAGDETFASAFKEQFCGDMSDEELNQSLGELMAALSGCDPELVKAVASTFISDLSLVLTPLEIVELLNGEANPHAMTIVYNVAAQAYPDTFGQCAGFETPADTANTLKIMGRFADEKYKNKVLLGVKERAQQPILPALCVPEALELFNETRCTLLASRGLTPEQCAALLDQLRERAKEDIAALSDLKQNGLGTLDDMLPPLISPDPCAPAFLPTVMPADAASMAEASSKMFSNLDELARTDLESNQRWTYCQGGLINMIMSNRNGDGFARHVDNVMDGDDNLFPTTVAAWLRDKHLRDGEFLDSVATKEGDEKQTIIFSSDSWGVNSPRSFISDLDHKDLGERDTVDSDNTSTISVKEPDIKMKWSDYRTGDKVDFQFEYSDFETDDDDRPILNDYFRFKVVDDPTISAGNFQSTPTAGFEGRQRSEAEMRELILSASTESIDFLGNLYPVYSMNLDIDEHLEDQKSPRNSLYAKYILEKMKQMDSAGSMDSALELYSNSVFDAYYDYRDDLVEKYLKKFANRISSETNDGFLHGFPTSFVEQEDSDGRKYFDSPELGSPSLIVLDDNFVNPKTGEKMPVQPEYYGGTAERPAFYCPPPTFGGWGRMMQAFIPERTSCEPHARSGAGISELSLHFDKLFNTIVEDSRVGSDPMCFSETPWNKILDRTAQATIETMIRATIRLYAVEWLIIGMPSFSVYKPDFSNMFDDFALGFIADRIEAGLLEYEPRGGRPNIYYFSFMEQVAQAFGAKLTRGELTEKDPEAARISTDITEAEAEAVKALRDQQTEWLEEVSPLLTKLAYPNLIQSGLMAAVGSPFGPEASFVGSVLGAIRLKETVEERREEYWYSYVADSENLEHMRTLLYSFIEEELGYLSESLSSSFESEIPDIYNAFLGDDDMILGALNESVSSGPWNVASSDNGSTMSHEKLFENVDRVEDTPFMLEKYIRVTDYDYDYDDTGKLQESIPLMALENMSEAEINIVRRVDMPHLQGVINLEDWKKYLETNASLFDGLTVNQLWKSWEIGLRISHVFQSTTAVGVGWVPSSLDGEGRILNKAFNIDGTATKEDGTSVELMLVPLVATEKESETWSPPPPEDPDEVISSPTISDLAGSLNLIYAAELDCLISDLRKTPEYSVFFDYAMPMRRLLSIMTVYIMKTFLPSIGSAEDEWLEPGGINRLLCGRCRFYGWDLEDHMPRSKKTAKSMFFDALNGANKDAKSTRPSRSGLDKNFGGISWSLFWWLRRMQRYEVTDADGNPCD